jgi:hypothetical protein
MKLACYQVMHVSSMVLLMAVVFQAFAHPAPSHRRRTLCLVGVLGFATLVGGFGLVSTMKVGFPAWVAIKLGCWFGLMAISGMGYRKPERIPLLTVMAGLLLLTAITTVYFRHILGGPYE